MYSDDLGQPGGDGKAAPVRDGAEENVKVAHPAAQAGLEIAVAHGQLVVVAEHGQVGSFFHPGGCLLMQG